MDRGSEQGSSRRRVVSLLALVVLVGVGCPANEGNDDGVASIESGNDSGPGNTDTTGTDGATGLDQTADTAADSTDTGLIMNACGTFDPNEPGDGVVPQDPDDPEIISACTAFCEVMVGVADCTTDPAWCLDECKLRSCEICPGTLAPLVMCEIEFFVPDSCECFGEGLMCWPPENCSAELAATSQCGG